MRPDGKRVKDLPPIVAAIPYIMPKRYDAQNTITEYIDEELIKSYIREKRRTGVRINHMAVIIAAYYRAVMYNPKLNYFIMNSKVYKRNHFCVSFVILKKLTDGRPDETSLKIFLTPEDTVFSIQQKITDAVSANAATEQKNNTDKFARMMFSIPLLPKLVIWLAYHLDKLGLLPRKIIDLSPFHTSMFITNLASIKTSYIHQDQLYPSPLLRVRHHQRVRVHGQARAGLHERQSQQEDHAPGRGDGRADLHRL